MSWLAVHTKARRETDVVEGLNKLGLEAYCPTYEATVRHARRVYDVVRPYFSRYVFLRHEPINPAWAIAFTRERRERLGISAFVFAGESALLIPDVQIQELRAREESGWIPESERPLPPVVYTAGEKVRIRSGPLNNFLATIARVDSVERVRVWVEIMGRQSLVQSPVVELEKLSPTGAAA